jgi:hypothetical protein
VIRSESGGDHAEIAIAVVLFQDIRLRERAWRANDFAALTLQVQLFFDSDFTFRRLSRSADPDRCDWKTSEKRLGTRLP